MTIAVPSSYTLQPGAVLELVPGGDERLDDVLFVLGNRDIGVGVLMPMMTTTEMVTYLVVMLPTVVTPEKIAR